MDEIKENDDALVMEENEQLPLQEVENAEAVEETESEQQSEANEEKPETEDESNSDDMERLIAEAEHRGYIKGRNERIDELMSTSRMWQPEHTIPHAEGAPQVMILDNLRRSVWD